MNLQSILQKNPFVLAPMAGITDKPFRSFMREMGCSVVISELVSSNGLIYNSDKTIKLMAYEEKQSPVGIQLFGETPEIIAEAAKKVEDFGVDFVDLNFGCPVKKVVKKGAGSAVLKDLNQLSKILRTVKSAINIPLTIKIRTGWDEETKNADQVTQVAYDEGISWVGIHGRTRAAGYSGKADWDYIKRVKASSPLPILGNGDILTAEQAVSRIKESNCDGVMIGRGCLKNPYIFLQAMSLWQSDNPVEKNYSVILESLYSHLENHYDERIVNIQWRKLASWFSAGYRGSAAFRKSLYACSDAGELKELVMNYFIEIKDFDAPDTADDGFLMGGHG